MSLQRRNIAKQRFTVTDLVIVVIGVGIVATLSAWQWQDEHAADIAIIHRNDAPPLRLALHEDRLHHVRGRLGDSLFEVHDGRIRFKDSPCSHHVCVRAGWLQESGEAAACLPNGVSVVLHSDSPRYDSINY